MRPRRLVRIFAVGDWIVIGLAASLAWWSYGQGKSAVKVADPPRNTNLAIVARVGQPGATEPSLRGALPYKADVTVNLPHGCRNPVSVAVALQFRSPEMTGTSIQRVFKPIQTDVAISDPDVGAFRGQPSSDDSRQLAIVAKRVATSQVPNGGWVAKMTAAGLSRPELYFSFAADWVRSRTTRSCFVLLPDLSGDDAERAETLDTAIPVIAALPARVGRVAIGSRSGALEPFESIPPPTNLRDQSWSCSYDTRKDIGTPCAGIAVFDEPNASGAAAARIFFYGALFGVFLTVLIETIRRIRLPPPA